MLPWGIFQNLETNPTNLTNLTNPNNLTKSRSSSERVSTLLPLDNFPHSAPDAISLRNVPLLRMIFPNDTENIDNMSDFTRNYSDFSELIRNPHNLEENSKNKQVSHLCLKMILIATFLLKIL